MNGFAGFLARSLRGVRMVEFGALVVLLVMVLGVYLAKASAGRERGDITAVQAHQVAVNAEHDLLHALPRLSAVLVHADPQSSADLHAVLASHR